MENELQTCNMEYLSISVIFLLTSFLVIGTRKLYEKAVQILRSMDVLRKPQPSVAVNLHREVAELRRTTSQISKDWGAMVEMVTSIRDQQCADKSSLKNEIKSMNDSLQDRISWFQEEEAKDNDQRFQKINNLIESIRLEMDSLKDVVQNNGSEVLKTIQEYKPLNVNMAHMSCQTEKEIYLKRKTQEDKATVDKSNINSSSKLSFRKLLYEFQNEMRTNSCKDREELITHIEIILTQINNDRDVIKSAVQQAFAASTFQSQQCFEKFGAAGQEVLTYIAEKSDKTNLLMKDKFQEFDKKLKEIFEGMKTTSFDMTYIKNTLDNIDSQMDDIFKRIELGCQKNVEHCEEVLSGLENAADVWKDSTQRLTEMAQAMCDINSGVEHLMDELKDRPGDSNELDLNLDKSIVDATYEASGQNISRHQNNLNCFLKMQSLVQTCAKKVASLNDKIENGSGDISLAMENLLRQIRFMCDLVESVGERFKFLEVETRQVAINQETKFQGDVNSETTVMESGSQTSCAFTVDSRVPVDTNIRSPKKPKFISKLKPPSSPMKRGKTIYSDSSSNNSYAKLQERHQGNVWK